MVVSRVFRRRVFVCVPELLLPRAKCAGLLRACYLRLAREERRSKCLAGARSRNVSCHMCNKAM